MPMISTPEPGRPYVLITPENDGEELALIDELVITSLYKEYGAILFRGFRCDKDVFAEMAGRFCINTIYNRSPGRITIDEDKNIQTVNLGTAAFSLHPELSRLPWKPDVCWFCCLKPPLSGGETTICDGIQVVQNMATPVRDAYISRRLRYTAITKSEECEYWFGSAVPTDEQLQNPGKNCPFQFIRLPRQIVKTFTFPALHEPMFSTGLAFGNFLLFARYTKQNLRTFPVFEDGSIVPDELVAAVKDIGDRLQVPIKWQKGDLLMLDNTRFMHGRNQISDEKDRLIISLFGYLKFAEPNNEELTNAPWRQKGVRLPY